MFCLKGSGSLQVAAPRHTYPLSNIATLVGLHNNRQMKLNITSTYTATDLVPISIARAHVRALDDTEDNLLDYYLQAAIDYLGQQTNRVLGTATAVAYIDLDEVDEVVKFHGLNDVTAITVEYLNDQGAYAALDASEYTENLAYPCSLDLTDAYPADLSSDTDNLFKVTISCGAALSTLPRQYVQAALLLVGHYYNQREAEVIGQITSELKEGVRRLVMSARQF